MTLVKCPADGHACHIEANGCTIAHCIFYCSFDGKDCFDTELCENGQKCSRREIARKNFSPVTWPDVSGLPNGSDVMKGVPKSETREDLMRQIARQEIAASLDENWVREIVRSELGAACRGFLYLLSEQK